MFRSEIAKLFVGHGSQNPKLGRMRDENLWPVRQGRRDLRRERGQIFIAHVERTCFAGIGALGRATLPGAAEVVSICDSTFRAAPNALCGSGWVRGRSAFS
jgi:hypothetical protein